MRAELAELRAKQAPIQIDPSEGRITIDNYQTDQFTINQLSVQSDSMKELAHDLSQIEKWIQPDANSPSLLPDLNTSLAESIEVENLKITLPFKSVNTMIPKIVGRQLDEAGIKNMTIQKGRNPNEVSIQGKAKKFMIEVGFNAVGQLNVNKKGQPIFSLGQVRVAGLAVPNFFASLATAVLAGSDLQELGVKQSGEDFILDPKKMLPPNIQANLSTLRVGSDGFIIEGGSSLKND